MYGNIAGYEPGVKYKDWYAETFGGNLDLDGKFKGAVVGKNPWNAAFSGQMYGDFGLRYAGKGVGHYDKDGRKIYQDQGPSNKNWKGKDIKEMSGDYVYRWG